MFCFQVELGEAKNLTVNLIKNGRTQWEELLCISPVQRSLTRIFIFEGGGVSCKEKKKKINSLTRLTR